MKHSSEQGPEMNRCFFPLARLSLTWTLAIPRIVLIAVVLLGVAGYSVRLLQAEPLTQHDITQKILTQQLSGPNGRYPTRLYRAAHPRELQLDPPDGALRHSVLPSRLANSGYIAGMLKNPTIVKDWYNPRPNPFLELVIRDTDLSPQEAKRLWEEAGGDIHFPQLINIDQLRLPSLNFAVYPPVEYRDQGSRYIISVAVADLREVGAQFFPIQVAAFDKSLPVSVTLPRAIPFRHVGGILFTPEEMMRADQDE